jgi:hypothetical protein
MKRAITRGLALYVLCGVVGRVVEGMGVVRCGCAADCWCRRPGLSTLRWVFPFRHRSVPEPTPEPVREPAVEAVRPRGGAASSAPSAPAATRRTPRYWLYKKKDDQGADVFSGAEPVEWGGHHSTRSAEVANTLNDDVAVGDVVVAYQTDLKAVTGYLRLARIEGRRDERRLFVRALHRLDPPFPIHQHKAGTTLAGSPAVGGSVMLRELSAEEMRELVHLSGAPQWLLEGGEPEAHAG